MTVAELTEREQEHGDFLRIKRAMKYFGVSESFLRHAIMNGEINHYKLRGAIFVSIREIEKMIEDGKV